MLTHVHKAGLLFPVAAVYEERRAAAAQPSAGLTAEEQLIVSVGRLAAVTRFGSQDQTEGPPPDPLGNYCS